MSQLPKARQLITAVGVAAITITGVWYGAGLKLEREAEQVTKKRREASTEEKLAQLDDVRAGLVAKRVGLERKIAELEVRKSGGAREDSSFDRGRKR